MKRVVKLELTVYSVSDTQEGQLVTIEEVIGQRVGEKRRLLGLTQAEVGSAVAEYLGEPWSRQTVWAAENGKRDWRAADLVAIAHVLGVAPGWLMLPPDPLTDIELAEGRSVPASSMIAVTASLDVPPLDALWEILGNQENQISNALQLLEAAKSNGQMGQAMLRREERKK